MDAGSIFRFSSCEADFCSSDEDFEDTVDDVDVDYVGEDQDDKEEKTILAKRFSETEMILMLRSNNGDVDATLTELLQGLTGDSLNNLSSQNDRAMEKKRSNLKYRLLRLREKFKKKKLSIERFDDFGGDKNFISASQDSFVNNVWEEKASKDQDDEDMEQIDDINSTPCTCKCTCCIAGCSSSGTTYRKPLNHIKDDKTLKSRVEDIFYSVKKEAIKQGVSTHELLACMQARDSYITRRKFALNMMKIFRGNEGKTEAVSLMEAAAIVSRGKMGRSAYNFARRRFQRHTVIECHIFH